MESLTQLWLNLFDSIEFDCFYIEYLAFDGIRLIDWTQWTGETARLMLPVEVVATRSLGRPAGSARARENVAFSRASFQCVCICAPRRRTAKTCAQLCVVLNARSQKKMRCFSLRSARGAIL